MILRNVRCNNENFLFTGCVRVRTYDFHYKMCNNNTFLLFMKRFDGKAWFLLFCHALKLYMILYTTGTVYDTVHYRYCIWYCTLQVLYIILYTTRTVYDTVYYRYCIWYCKLQVVYMKLYTTCTVYDAVHYRYYI